MDWQKAINQLAEDRKISIRQLAADLGVSQQFLNDVARGSKPASPMLKLKVLDRLGYDLTRDTLLLIFPDDIAQAIREHDVARGQKRSTKKADKRGDQEKE